MNSAKHNGTERRKYVRIPSEDVLLVEPFTLTGTGPKVRAFTRNLSAGGLLFETDGCFNIGSILRLEIDIPGWEKFKPEFYKFGEPSGRKPLVVLGKVVRIEDVGNGMFDTGVVFCAVDDGHKLALRKYVDNLKPGNGAGSAQ